MGRKLILTGTKLTDPNAPILSEVDPIFPGSGALVYIDPAHPYRPWGDGVPAHQSLLPNLAEAQAMNATGLTANNVSPQMFLLPGWGSNGNLIERSAKGGLHASFSPAAWVEETGAGYYVDYFESRTDRAFNAWWLANKSHKFYAAKWGRWSRGINAATAGSNNWQHSRIASSNQAISFYARPGSGSAVYPTGATLVGSSSVNATPARVGPYFYDGAVSDALAATAATFQPSFGVRSNSVTASCAPAEILYGYYLEDLTISGRSYAQVNALVRAKFEKDVNTPGGRYYEDTFSAPAQ